MKATVLRHFNYSASSVQSHAFLYFCRGHPEKSPKLDCPYSVLHLRCWVLERMDTGFCDLRQRHIQVIQTFFGSLWCGNLDDIPLKGASFHPSQMPLQFLTMLISWDISQNPVLPQLLFSPQPHQWYLLSLLSQWKSHLPFSKASLFTFFTLEPPSSCFLNDLTSSSSVPSTHKWTHLSSIFKTKQN